MLRLLLLYWVLALVLPVLGEEKGPTQFTLWEKQGEELEPQLMRAKSSSQDNGGIFLTGIVGITDPLVGDFASCKAFVRAGIRLKVPRGWRGCKVYLTCQEDANHKARPLECGVTAHMNTRPVYCDADGIDGINLCDTKYKPILGTANSQRPANYERYLSPPPLLAMTSIGGYSPEIAVFEGSDKTLSRVPPGPHPEIKKISCDRIRQGNIITEATKKDKSCKVELTCLEDDGKTTGTSHCTILKGFQRITHCGDPTIKNDKRIEYCDNKLLDTFTVKGLPHWEKSKGTQGDEALDSNQDCDGDEEMSHDGPPTQHDFQPGYAETVASDADCDGDVDLDMDTSGQGDYIVHLGSEGNLESVASFNLDPVDPAVFLHGKMTTQKVQFRDPQCSDLPTYEAENYNIGTGCQAMISCYEGPENKPEETHRVCRLNMQKVGVVEVDQCQQKLKSLQLPWCDFNDEKFKNNGF